MPDIAREGAERAALAGLAREVDALARRVDALDPLGAQVVDLGQVVAALAERLAAPDTGPGGTAAGGSWFALRGHPQAAAVLADLDEWVHAVYLSYPDAAAALPSCWPRHGEVVEELLWLHRAWTAAYYGAYASPAAAGDWHDRRRPGVLARLRHLARCSPQRHGDAAGPGPRRGPAPLSAAEIRAVLEPRSADLINVKDTS